MFWGLLSTRGRAQESVSECPWINGAYAINFVRGIQDSANDTYLQVWGIRRLT
jgi:hypothetical protein